MTEQEVLDAFLEFQSNSQLVSDVFTSSDESLYDQKIPLKKPIKILVTDHTETAVQLTKFAYNEILRRKLHPSCCPAFGMLLSDMVSNDLNDALRELLQSHPELLNEMIDPPMTLIYMFIDSQAVKCLRLCRELEIPTMERFEPAKFFYDMHHNLKNGAPGMDRRVAETWLEAAEQGLVNFKSIGEVNLDFLSLLDFGRGGELFWMTLNDYGEEPLRAYLASKWRFSEVIAELSVNVSSSATAMEYLRAMAETPKPKKQTKI